MFHQTIIVGNLGADPELRYLQSGKGVCNFNVAVSERWNDRATNEMQERTTWYKVAVWGKQAESCNTYLARGRRVMVVGNVSASAYTNKAGEPTASLELNARTVKFMGGQEDSNQQRGGGYQPSGGRKQPAPSRNDGDEIPF